MAKPPFWVNATSKGWIRLLFQVDKGFGVWCLNRNKPKNCLSAWARINVVRFGDRSRSQMRLFIDPRGLWPICGSHPPHMNHEIGTYFKPNSICVKYKTILRSTTRKNIDLKLRQIHVQIGCLKCPPTQFRSMIGWGSDVALIPATPTLPKP